MAETIDLQVIVPTLPPGGCIDPQIRSFMQQLRVLFPAGYALHITGPNEPSVEERDYLWDKTDSITGALLGTFSWSALYGLWLKPHWIGASVPSNERRIYLGSLTSLETFDGGESATVSDTTGPFWKEDTDFQDKWPLGVGATLSTVATDQDVFDDATPGAPQGRGVYFIKPTGRIYDRAT